MKVAICGGYPYKKEPIWGGVHAVLFNLNKGLKKYSNLNYNIITHTNKCEKDIEKIKNIYYLKDPKIYIGTINYSFYPLKVNHFFKKHNYDLINAHTIDFAYNNLKNVNKLIFTIHGINWEEMKYFTPIQKFLWKNVYIKQTKKVLKHVKYIISINNYVNKVIENKTNAMIININNPVQDKYFKIKDNSKENQLFYIGVINRRKNLYSLIKALVYVKREISNFHLNIAGKVTDKKYFDNIQNFINKNNLKKNIQYLGIISEEEKIKQFSNMNVLILPSLQETAPMVISESFASGKPVITSNRCGMPSMINHGNNGLLFNPEDPIDIANKIIYLLNNKNEYNRMRINTKSFAIENHSIKKVTKSYHNLFKEIMNN